MASIRQIANLVQYRMNKPYDVMLYEAIKFSIKYWRAFLIRQDFERNGVSPEFTQRFTKKLIIVDKGDSCAAIIGCPVMRTETAVPKPVRVKSSDPFLFVGEFGGGEVWTYTQLEEMKYIVANKYTSKIVRYDYINNYLYIFDRTNHRKFVTIEHIFVNPNEALDECLDVECFSDDDDFPIGEDMIRTIVQGLLTGEYKMLEIPKQDEVKIEE